MKDLPWLKKLLQRYGQEHLLRWWDELYNAHQASLAAQIEAIDFEELAPLCRAAQEPAALKISSAQLAPPPMIGLPASQAERQRWQEARQQGQALLAAGKVAVLMVAGGQGTRLNFEHPKGMYPIGPISGKSLFQLHAEKVLAISRRYETEVPYYIMTSEATHEETVRFFERHHRFGLPAQQVTFFHQGDMPALDATTGKVLLAARDRIATSPNGHGGVLAAMVEAGIHADLQRRGITLIYYHQVDNPLTNVGDPELIGFHAQRGSEISTKAVAKQNPDDQVGLLVQLDGKACIIEYSDLPKDVAEQRDDHGRLRFWAGNMAIHLLNVDFLQRLHAGNVQLPYHRARKTVPYLDERGELIEPEAPNAFKFERFLFDVLPLARETLVVETARSVEYDPLKNACGEHSPESVKRSLSRLYAGWLVQAGATVPPVFFEKDGKAPALEISPLFALDADALRGKLPAKLQLEEPLYLEENQR